jgi:hypothetical protein
MDKEIFKLRMKNILIMDKILTEKNRGVEQRTSTQKRQNKKAR